jgi:hypothetical protein
MSREYVTRVARTYMYSKHKLILIFLVLFFISFNALSQDIQKGIVAGLIVTPEGVPVSLAQVLFFNAASGPPPSHQHFWRVPDHITKTDEAGKFFTELPEGKYFVTAIKRNSGESMGPPAEGDYLFSSKDPTGAQKSVEIKAGIRVYVEVSSDAFLYKKEADSSSETTAVQGTIFDDSGNPLKGALVLAFATPEVKGRHTRPLFVSERTGSDGLFTLKVKGGGTYYLRARSLRNAGPPAAGEMISDPGLEGAVAVVLEKGQVVKGIEIRTRKYQGRKAETEKLFDQVQKNQTLQSE